MFIFIILSTIALISIIISICSVSQSSSVANESNFNYDISNKNEDFDFFDYNRNNFIIEYNEIVYEDNVSIIDNKCRVYYKDFNSCDSSTMNVSDENGNVYTVFNHQSNYCKCWYDEHYDSGYGYNFSDEYDSYYDDNSCSDDYYGSYSYDGWLSSESDEDNGWF